MMNTEYSGMLLIRHTHFCILCSREVFIFVHVHESFLEDFEIPLITKLLSSKASNFTIFFLLFYERLFFAFFYP